MINNKKISELVINRIEEMHQSELFNAHQTSSISSIKKLTYLLATSRSIENDIYTNWFICEVRRASNENLLYLSECNSYISQLADNSGAHRSKKISKVREKLLYELYSTVMRKIGENHLHPEDLSGDGTSLNLDRVDIDLITGPGGSSIGDTLSSYGYGNDIEGGRVAAGEFSDRFKYIISPSIELLLLYFKTLQLHLYKDGFDYQDADPLSTGLLLKMYEDVWRDDIFSRVFDDSPGLHQNIETAIKDAQKYNSPDTMANNLLLILAEFQDKVGAAINQLANLNLEKDFYYPYMTRRLINLLLDRCDVASYPELYRLLLPLDDKMLSIGDEVYSMAFGQKGLIVDIDDIYATTIKFETVGDIKMGGLYSSDIVRIG